MKKNITVLLVFVLLLSSIFLVGQTRAAVAKESKILEFDTMVGVPRPFTGSSNAIRGINGGGFPWVVGSAHGELKQSGKVEVMVSGLVIDPNDPAAISAGVAGKNPVANFKVVVSCLSKDASGNAVTVNLSTKLAPADANGNASIEDTLTLPKPCIAPILFVTSPGGAWFASTGY